MVRGMQAPLLISRQGRGAAISCVKPKAALAELIAELGWFWGDLRFNGISSGPLMLGEHSKQCWCLQLPEPYSHVPTPFLSLLF